MELITAQQIVAAEREVKAELARLEREKQQILEDSTESRFEKNRREMQVAIDRRCEIQRAQGQLIARTPLPPRHAVLVAELKRLGYEEQSVRIEMRGYGITGVPTEYIRPDATAFFQRERDAAEERITKLMAPFNRPNVAPGPRILDERDELRATLDRWPATARLCEAGERIRQIRERRAALDAEKLTIENTRHREALAVA
jgi:hypothetical protein